MRGVGLHPWPWKTALLLFALCVFLLGSKLDFSGYVHADEPNKVHQITQDKYNFNHPLLMLNSVRLYAHLAGISDNYDRVIRAGRWSSVIFAALAVALLVLVTGRLHGVFIAVAAGTFVLTTPLFFELAHYFKEDPSLLFGVGLSLVAMQVYGEKPSHLRAALLGAACGVAASGKYAGLMVLPFAVYAVVAAHRARDLGTLVFFALGVFTLINLPMLSVPELWKSRVDLEVSRLQAPPLRNPRSIPHGVYFAIFRDQASPVILGLIAVYVASIWRRKFRLSPVEWSLLLLPAIYIAVLSFIPTTSDRYILPVSVLLACVAAAGLGPLLGLKHGKYWAGLLVAASVAWQSPRLYAENLAFASRRHDEVLAFIEAKLPPSAVVLADNYQSLAPRQEENPTLKQRPLEPNETLDTLRQSGVTHLLITSKRYPIFTPDNRKTSGLSPGEDEKMRELYAEIFSRCRLVFEWQEGAKKQLAPEFRLYELPKNQP